MVKAHRQPLEFVVDHPPVAQPRYTQGKGGGAFLRKSARRRETAVVSFKEVARGRALEAALKRGWPLAYEGPLRVDVVYVLERPQRLGEGSREWAAGVPDRDNLDKALLDALNGCLWKDDRQVVSGESIKVYAASGEAAHAEVTVCPAERGKHGEVLACSLPGGPRGED